MQIKNNLSNRLQKPVLILVKLLLFTLGVFFLVGKLKEQQIGFFDQVLPAGFFPIVSVVLFLMTFNWYLEVIRWKVSIKVFEPISSKDAWVAVLSGLALNWTLPLTTGDLISRISQTDDKYKATSAAFLNRGIMLAFTMMLGLYGISKLATLYKLNGWFAMIILFMIPVLRYFFRKSIDQFLSYFKKLDYKTLLKIFGLSFTRYFVFVFQFYLLLHLFLPELSVDLLIAGIGWIFLIRSVLPLFLGGVGVREASGVLFFQSYVSDIQLVIIPIFFIWIINTVIPSMIGMVLIWRLRG